MAKFAVRKTQKTGGKRIEIFAATLEASVTQQETGNYHAVPLASYTEELAKAHLLRKKIPEFTLENLQKAFRKTLGESELCRTVPPADGLPLPVTNLSKPEASNF